MRSRLTALVLPILRRAAALPCLTAAWLLAPICLGLTLLGFGHERDLSKADGFSQAVAALTEAQPDFVVVWPPEAAATLGALPKALLAADAVPLETDNNRSFRRIAVLGPAGFDSPPELDAAEALPRQRFGALELAQFQYANAPRTLFDLRAEVARARVSLAGPAVNVACDVPRADGGRDCPGRPEWNHVGPTELAVLGKIWPCVWAHPLAQHQLVLDLGEQTLGDQLELEAALSDSAALTPGGAGVQLTLVVTPPLPAPVVTRTLWRANAPGVVSLIVPTTGLARANVVLQITTPSDGRRHLGINLRIVDDATSRAGTSPGVVP